MSVDSNEYKLNYIRKKVDAECKKCPDADRDILFWIFKFGCIPIGIDDLLCEKFTKGYCYYFAHMLLMAFPNGKVMFDGYGHFLYTWCGVPYDITGVNLSCKYLIPESALGERVIPYKHNSDFGLIYKRDYEDLRIAKYETIGGKEACSIGSILRAIH